MVTLHLYRTLPFELLLEVKVSFSQVERKERDEGKSGRDLLEPSRSIVTLEEAEIKRMPAEASCMSACNDLSINDLQ